MNELHSFLVQIRNSVKIWSRTPEQLVLQVAHAMELLLAHAELPAAGWASPSDWHGKLLYEDPDTGFIVVLMTWGAHARTPVHDHGTWGVFGVCESSLQFTNFVEVREQTVQPVGRFVANIGDVSYIVPPNQEIHEIVNPNTTIARSLHVYGRNIGF